MNHYIDPKKFFTTNNCIGCGKCAGICPTRNIILNDKKRPVWGNECIRCLACFHWCPGKAVSSKGRILSREQYHHPDITFQDIAIQKLPGKPTE